MKKLRKHGKMRGVETLETGRTDEPCVVRPKIGRRDIQTAVTQANRLAGKLLPTLGGDWIRFKVPRGTNSGASNTRGNSPTCAKIIIQNRK